MLRVASSIQIESFIESASQPTLSVVIPTFNVEPWITECIRSIQTQSVDSIQIIVVDDGSTDRTHDILTELAQVDPRMLILRNTGKGSAAARNLGVDSAKGKYLAFADGDDIVPQGAYFALIASLEESDSDLAMGDYLTFTATKTWRRNSNLPLYGVARRGITIEDEPRLFRDRVCWNKVYRLDWWMWNCIVFANSRRSNDISAMTRAFALSTMDIVPVTTYLYRRRIDNSSMTSRRGEYASIVQYLQQEVSCLHIVLSGCSGAVQLEYMLGILMHDVWAVIPAVVDHSLSHDAADNSDFALIALLITEIVTAAPLRVRRQLSTQQRWVYELIEAGEMSLIALVPGRRPAAESWKRATDNFPDSLVKYGRWSSAVGESAKSGLTEVLRSVLFPGLAAAEPDLTEPELAHLAAGVLAFQRSWVPRGRLDKSQLRVLDAIGGNKLEQLRPALGSQRVAPIAVDVRFTRPRAIEITIDPLLIRESGELMQVSMIAVSCVVPHSEVRFPVGKLSDKKLTFSLDAASLRASKRWDLRVDPGSQPSGAPQLNIVSGGVLPLSNWRHQLYVTVTKQGSPTLMLNVKPSVISRVGILVRRRFLRPRLVGKSAR